MIQIEDVLLQYSDKVLFDHINLAIYENERIGLVGRNGSGKSTLLKLIIGEITPEKGKVFRKKTTQTGYLPQEMSVLSSKSIFEEAKEAFEPLIKLQEKITFLYKELEKNAGVSAEKYQTTLEKIQDYENQLLIKGGKTFEGEIEKVLLGLGFERSDFSRPINTFSGGWQMRIEIAKILLRKPDIILLDEPTNHLDIESIQWLEQFLIKYEGAIVLISHDRAFLDAITKKTLEIEQGKIYEYAGNYSKAVQMRQQRIEQQEAIQKNQEKKNAATQEFIDRFRYKDSKAKQVQSKIKMLEKQEKQEIVKPDTVTMTFSFPEAIPSGKIVVETQGLSKSYEDKQVLKDIDFVLLRGQKIALVGKNGEGKTTFARVMAGQTGYDGDMKIGHNVKTAFYQQNQADMLNYEKTVFETIDDEAKGELRKRVRALLGAFLFSGETVDKKVKVLSGGEKARLSLAKLFTQEINFLIMDEPTNHLDMLSKDVLKDVLKKYKGTLVIISHDRDFLAGLSDMTYEVSGRGVKRYDGDVYYYIEKKKKQNNALKDNKTGHSSDSNQIKRSKLEHIQKKEQERKKRKIEKQILELETKINSNEKRLKQIEERLNDPVKFQKEIEDQKLYQQYDEIKKTIEVDLKQWEGFQIAIDDMRMQF